MKKRIRVSSLKHIVKTNWPFMIMVMPATILLLINNYLPMAGIIMAFKKFRPADGILGSAWVGFENFKYLFNTPDAIIFTRNTFLYNISFIILNAFFGVGFALILNSIRNRLAVKFYQTVMFFPFFISTVVMSYIVYAFLSPSTGFLNTWLLPMLGTEGVNWYAKPLYWPFILAFVNTWNMAGYYCIIYFAALIGVSKEYYEAAEIDGASKWQQIFKISIPQISPVIITMTLLQAGRIFNANFGLFYNVPRQQGTLSKATQVIDVYVYNTMNVTGNFGMAAAGGLLQSTVGFIFIVMCNYLISRYNSENALF